MRTKEKNTPQIDHTPRKEAADHNDKKDSEPISQMRQNAHEIEAKFERQREARQRTKVAIEQARLKLKKVPTTAPAETSVTDLGLDSDEQTWFINAEDETTEQIHDTSEICSQLQQVYNVKVNGDGTVPLGFLGKNMRRYKKLFASSDETFHALINELTQAHAEATPTVPTKRLDVGVKESAEQMLGYK